MPGQGVNRFVATNHQGRRPSIASNASRDSDMELGEINTKAAKLLRKGEFSKITHQDIVALFKEFDMDADGDLSLDEIDNLLGKVITDVDLQVYIKAMLAAGDKDNNGSLTIGEFHQALKLGSLNEVEDLLRVMHGEKQTEGCTTKVLKGYLQDRIKTNENCISLPFYIVFFGLIWVLTVYHLEVYYTHRQNLAHKAVLIDAPKMNSLWWTSPNHFWDWVEDHIVPAVFESTPIGRITSNNQVVGGLLLERNTAETRLCYPGKLRGLYKGQESTECYGDLKENKQARWFPLEALPQPCECIPCGEATPKASTQFTSHGSGVIDQGTPNPGPGNLNAYGSGVCAPATATCSATEAGPGCYTKCAAGCNCATLKCSDPLRETRQELKDLRMSQWLNNATRSVDVSLISHNGQNGFLTFSRLTFDIEEGGHWLLNQHIESFDADPYDSERSDYGLLICLDVMFCCMAVFIFSYEIKSLIDLKRSGLPFKTAFLEHYFEFWKIVDWVNITQSFFLVLHWFFDVKRTLGMVEDLLRLPKLGEPGYQNAPTELFEKAYESSMGYKDLRWYVTVFTVTSMLRFFKAFRANPRLNIVTRTIVVAAKDLAHFAIVFLSIFFAFVLMGHLIFGPRVSHFSALKTACDTCVMMLVGFVLDDIRADMLKNTGSTGITWIYAYVVVMQLLLVNMILVVIFDVYAEVKGNVHNAPTLYEQVVELFKKKKRQIERIRQAKKALKKKSVSDAEPGSPHSPDTPFSKASSIGSNDRSLSRGSLSSVKNKTADELIKMSQEVPETNILNVLQGDGQFLAAMRDDNWTPDALSATIRDLSSSQARDLIWSAKEFARAEQAKEDAVSLYDAVRLIARVDANVREVMRFTQQQETQALAQDASKRLSQMLSQGPAAFGVNLDNKFASCLETTDTSPILMKSTLPPVPPQSRGVPHSNGRSISYGARGHRIVE